MQESVPCCDLFKLFLARIRRLREVRWNKTKTYSFYCCPSVLFLSQNVTLRGRKSSLKHFLYSKTGLNRQNLIFFLSALLESETWSLRILATGNYFSIDFSRPITSLSGNVMYIFRLQTESHN